MKQTFWPDAADGLQVVEHFLHEDLAEILPDFHLQLGIASLQDRQHDVGQQSFGRPAPGECPPRRTSSAP